MDNIELLLDPYLLEDSCMSKLVMGYSKDEFKLILENVTYYSPMNVSSCSLILTFYGTQLKKIIIEDIHHDKWISDVKLNKINNNLYNMVIYFGNYTFSMLSIDFRDVEITKY